MQDQSAFKQSVSELTALLEEENIALVSGQFAVLKDIAERKLSLVQTVEDYLGQSAAGSLDENTRLALRGLQKLTEHNGALLKAAYNGSQAAQARLAELTNNQVNVGAYSATGRSIRYSDAVISRQKTV